MDHNFMYVHIYITEILQVSTSMTILSESF
jgi:hypothetical protein